MCSWDQWFNGLTVPLRYDPSLRVQKREAAKVAEDRSMPESRRRRLAVECGNAGACAFCPTL